MTWGEIIQKIGELMTENPKQTAAVVGVVSTTVAYFVCPKKIIITKKSEYEGPQPDNKSLAVSCEDKTLPEIYNNIPTSPTPLRPYSDVWHNFEEFITTNQPTFNSLTLFVIIAAYIHSDSKSLNNLNFIMWKPFIKNPQPSETTTIYTSTTMIAETDVADDNSWSNNSTDTNSIPKFQTSNVNQSELKTNNKLKLEMSDNLHVSINNHVNLGASIVPYNPEYIRLDANIDPDLKKRLLANKQYMSTHDNYNQSEVTKTLFTKTRKKHKELAAREIMAVLIPKNEAKLRQAFVESEASGPHEAESSQTKSNDKNSKPADKTDLKKAFTQE